LRPFSNLIPEKAAATYRAPSTGIADRTLIADMSRCANVAGVMDLRFLLFCWHQRSRTSNPEPRWISMVCQYGFEPEIARRVAPK
jgi:hypothetical protein